MTTKENLFKSSDRRDLKDVSGIIPPFAHHSLIGEVSRAGALRRFGEFMIFTDKAVHVDYIVAYTRTTDE